MDPKQLKQLELVVAQLRHAYAQLVACAVRNQPQFAEGLISPQIKALEAIITPKTEN